MFADRGMAGTSRCSFTRPTVGGGEVFSVALLLYPTYGGGVLRFFRGGYVALLLYPPYGGAYWGFVGRVKRSVPVRD
jgi:hypothetical protein